MVYRDDPSGNMVMSLPVGSEQDTGHFLAHLNVELGREVKNNWELSFPGMNYHYGTVHYNKPNGRGNILYNVASGQLGKEFGYVYDWWSHDYNVQAPGSSYTVLQPCPNTGFNLVCDTETDYWTYTQGSSVYRNSVILKDYMLSETVNPPYKNYYFPYMIGWRNNVRDAIAMICMHVRIHKNYYDSMMANCGLWFATPRSYRYNVATAMDVFMGKPTTLIGGNFFEEFKNANTTLPYVYPSNKAITIIPAYTESRATYHDYFICAAVDLLKRTSADAIAGDNNDSCRSVSMPALAIKGALPAVGQLSVVDVFVSIHAAA